MRQAAAILILAVCYFFLWESGGGLASPLATHTTSRQKRPPRSFQVCALCALAGTLPQVCRLVCAGAGCWLGLSPCVRWAPTVTPLSCGSAAPVGGRDPGGNISCRGSNSRGHLGDTRSCGLAGLLVLEHLSRCGSQPAVQSAFVGAIPCLWVCNSTASLNGYYHGTSLRQRGTMCGMQLFTGISSVALTQWCSSADWV